MWDGTNDLVWILIYLSQECLFQAKPFGTDMKFLNVNIAILFKCHAVLSIIKSLIYFREALMQKKGNLSKMFAISVLLF
jgi:hypothetical protein